MERTQERTHGRTATRAPRAGAVLALWLTLAVGAQATPSALQAAARAGAANTAQHLERELAEVELAFELERDPAAAQTQLEALAARAADPAGFGGQARTLASVALARARMLARSGRTAEALAALEVGASSAGTAEGSGLALALAEAQADPRVAELRAELAPQVPRQDPDEDPVLRHIRGLAGQNMLPHLTDPSRAQVRALRQLVLEARAGMSAGIQTHGGAALRALMKQVPLETAEFLMEELEGAGEDFRQLVLLVLAEANPLASNSAWSCRDRERPILLEPVWRDLLERLVGQGAAPRGALPLLSTLAARDALTPPLVEALRAALFSAQPDLVKGAFLPIAYLPGIEGVKPLYEALLEHPEAALRLSAARVLANYQDMGRLLEVVDSDDVALRTELARALGRESISVVRYGSNCSLGQQGEYVHSEQPAGRAAIVRLCADPDPSVRSLAVFAAGARKVELPGDVLLRLTADPEPTLAENLSLLEVRDPDLKAEFLLRLATSSNVTVAKRVATALSHEDWPAHPERFQPALFALLEHSPLEPAQRQEVGRLALRGVWSSPAATAAVVRRTLERDDAWLVHACIEAAAGRSTEGFAGLSQAEAIELVVRHVRGSQLSEDGWNDLGSAVDNLAQRQPAVAPVYRAAAALREQPLARRTWFLVKAVRNEGAERAGGASLAAIVDLLADRRWSEGESDTSGEQRRALEQLDKLIEAARGELWNGVVAASLADPKAPHRHLERILYGYDPLSVGGQEIAHAILARWPVEGETFHWFVAKTLRQGRELGLEPELLVRGLQLYPSAVVGAMSRWRDPAFLAPLALALEPDWIGSAGEREQVRRLAVQGLANQLSDDAARVLIEASERTGDEELRKLCFEGLETIRTFQEARERWERRVAERAARARALESLLSLLDDADPARRAAGLLALGELGDAQVLPRIAELAADRDATVRAAALEALRRLRPAPERAEPGPAPEGGTED